MTSHKDEALRALVEIDKHLASFEPIDGRLRRQLCGTVQYAWEQVQLIEETKRPRRRPKMLRGNEPADA